MIVFEWVGLGDSKGVVVRSGGGSGGRGRARGRGGSRGGARCWVRELSKVR